MLKEIKEYFDNGFVNRHYFIDDNEIRNGLYTVFNNEGKITLKNNYINGFVNGIVYLRTGVGVMLYTKKMNEKHGIDILLKHA